MLQPTVYTLQVSAPQVKNVAIGNYHPYIPVVLIWCDSASLSITKVACSQKHIWPSPTICVNSRTTEEQMTLFATCQVLEIFYEHIRTEFASDLYDPIFISMQTIFCFANKHSTTVNTIFFFLENLKEMCLITNVNNNSPKGCYLFPLNSFTYTSS